MSKRLYVGGLPYSVDNDQLRELFSQAGEVISAEVVYDRARENWSKGFGFVEMPDEAALAAIQMFHNAEVGGRTLTVNEARPREERPAGSFNRGGDRGGDRGGFSRGGDRGGFSRDDRGYGQQPAAPQDYDVAA
jgi:RNA recognition motif-containing protein